MININIKGHIVIIDKEDLEIILKYKWCTKKIGNIRYAMHRRYINRTKELAPLLMHRLILKPKKNQIIDHANRNGLDNRKSNLRICNHSQNGANSYWGKNISGFKGVSWHKAGKCWRARYTHRINNKRKEINLGLYQDPIIAAKAYDKYLLKIHGEFALTNKMLGRYE